MSWNPQNVRSDSVVGQRLSATPAKSEEARQGLLANASQCHQYRYIITEVLVYSRENVHGGVARLETFNFHVYRELFVAEGNEPQHLSEVHWVRGTII